MSYIYEHKIGQPKQETGGTERKERCCISNYFKLSGENKKTDLNAASTKC
jgi:hypothetical protein